MNQSPAESAQLFIFRILWGVFMLTIFLFGLVLFSAPLASADPIDGPQLVVPLSAAAAFAFILGFFLPKFIYGLSRKRANAPQGAVRYMIPWIIRMALLGSVALYGFVLSMVNREPKYYLPFAAATLAVYLMSFPSESRLKDLFD